MFIHLPSIFRVSHKFHSLFMEKLMKHYGIVNTLLMSNNCLCKRITRDSNFGDRILRNVFYAKRSLGLGLFTCTIW